MTASVRQRRPAPVGREPRAHTRPPPSLAVRRNRGPRPPEAIIAALQHAMRVELGLRQDATRAPGPQAAAVRFGQRWQVSAQRAAVALISAAKRGVARALAGAAKRGVQGALVAPTAAAVWVANLTRIVEAAAAKGAADAERAIAIETLRQHGTLVRFFAEQAGAQSYVWTTQSDTHVRTLHVELNGSVHTWANPPVSGTDGFRGAPGEPAECRCTAFPIMK